MHLKLKCVNMHKHWQNAFELNMSTDERGGLSAGGVLCAGVHRVLGCGGWSTGKILSIYKHGLEWTYEHGVECGRGTLRGSP